MKLVTHSLLLNTKITMLQVTKQLLTLNWHPLKASVRHYPYPTQFVHFLRNIPPMQTTKLCNGLTIVTEERECPNACIGIYVDAGPRVESDFENGITHFFEHIAFKGTFARSRTMLEDQMSCTGAKFKCHTTRDIAAYYAECLIQDVTLVIDILTDCVFNNAFLETEIENQKKVVYLEMLEHDKSANGLLDDYLHATAFQGTPLANTVMGTSSNLYNYNKCTIPTFMNRFYDANRTVLVAVGGVKHDQMVALAQQYLSKLEPTKCIDHDVYRFTGSDVRYRNDSMPAANCAIAVEGPALCDDDNVIMEVAANVIGGWDRSQPGGVDHGFPVARWSSTSLYCDAYKSFNMNYKDTGLWGVQFLGPTKRLDDLVSQVQAEWMALCFTVTESEVERGRRLLKTKMLSRNENMTATCHEIGKWVIYQGFMPPLHERVCAADRVRAVDVRRACYQYLYDKCPAVAAVGPTEGLTDYVRIRANMYWLRV